MDWENRVLEAYPFIQEPVLGCTVSYRKRSIILCLIFILMLLFILAGQATYHILNGKVMITLFLTNISIPSIKHPIIFQMNFLKNVC